MSQHYNQQAEPGGIDCGYFTNNLRIVNEADCRQGHQNMSQGALAGTTGDNKLLKQSADLIRRQPFLQDDAFLPGFDEYSFMDLPPHYWEGGQDGRLTPNSQVLDYDFGVHTMFPPAPAPAVPCGAEGLIESPAQVGEQGESCCLIPGLPAPPPKAEAQN